MQSDKGILFASMKSIRSISSRIIFALTGAALLTSCAGNYVGKRPVNSLYCDNFMIYEMCARDTDRDGIVEYVYFDDSKEIFMYRDALPRRLPRDIGVHRCARAMDESLVATTSRMFHIDEDTSLLEKTDIRGSLMIKYIAWMPEVTACNMRADTELATSD